MSGSEPRVLISRLSRRDIMAQYFNLSAPIGHAGVPMPETRRDVYKKCQPIVGSGSGPGLAEKCVFPDEFVLGERILSLPIEIKVKITNNLSQYDLVNLASVSKGFYDAAMFSLYERIVVDSSYSILNDSLRTDRDQRCTYIKTKYNLKKFMQVLSQDNMETAFPLGILVKSLKIITLPDGVSNVEISKFVHMSIGSMTRLSCLYWESGSRKLPFDTLQYLPNKNELTSLAINLDVSKCADVMIDFPQLQRLSVTPFIDSITLKQFMSQISIEHLADKLQVLQLKRQLPSMKQITKNNLNLGQSLIVTKYMLDNNLSRPDGIQSDKFLNQSLVDFDFWQFLDRLIDRGKRFIELSTLDVDSVNFLAQDSEKLTSAIRLENIDILSLNNVNEIQWLPEVDFHVTDFTSVALEHFHQGFLIGIAPHFRSLKKLRLNYQEANKDSIPQFLNLLSRNSISLEEIDLTIRWDQTKLATVSSWEQLMRSYANAICKHAKTLRKLSVVAQEGLKYYEIPKRIPVDAILRLTTCTNLESLRINGDSLQPSGVYLISRFPKLRFLSLHGKKSGGPPHMGLQMVHEGIMDDWYRVIHVAITVAQSNKNLQFVKIDKCLFECGKSGNAIPRPDVLNNWFSKQTRVMVTEDQF